MALLGPFEPDPALALAVSGGADSMALALLARAWAVQRGGSVLALVVDHGLRPESAAEAALTAERLAGQGIPSRVLRLDHLVRGPALAERARTARYEILMQACRQVGRLHLLLGHHAGDQAETLAMRVLRGSLSSGLSGMASLRETTSVRLLRPLLATPPALLRPFLLEHGVNWVEDPSNHDERALRPRLRHRMPQPDPALLQAACVAARHRARHEMAVAEVLAARVTMRPEGFAILTPGRIRPDALAALIRGIAGAPYALPPASLAALAANPVAATLGGVRLMPAGRAGAGFLVLREEAAMAGPQQAEPGSIWDHRFRLTGPFEAPTTVGKLGDASAAFRAMSPLPAAVLRTLPAFWLNGRLVGVPHLRHGALGEGPGRLVLTPPWPLAGPDFRPSAAKDCNFRWLGEPWRQPGCTDGNGTLC